MRLIFLLVLLSWSEMTLAGLGQVILPSEGFQQLCFLDYGEPSAAAYGGVCSGTLLNENTILTAAHCVSRQQPHSIVCGVRAEEVEVEQVFIHPQYQTGVMVDGVSTHVNDLAIIKLKRRIYAQPVPMVQLEEVLTQADKCAFFGYSMVSGTPRSKSVYPKYGWKLPLFMLRLDEGAFPVIQARGWDYPFALVQVGDSGGPLMCFINQQWKLLGVTSSRDYKWNSNFIPASEPFVKSHLRIDNDSLLSEEEQQLGLHASLLFSIEQAQVELQTLLNDLGRVSDVFQLTDEKRKELIGLLAVSGSRSLAQLRNDYLIMKNQYRITKDAAVNELLQNPNVALRLKPYSRLKFSDDSEGSLADLELNYFLVQQIDWNKKVVRGRLRYFGPTENFSCQISYLCQSVTLDNVEVFIEDFTIYMASAEIFNR